MLTIEWQQLSPNHGYTRPGLIDEIGLTDSFDAAMDRSAALFGELDHFGPAASYAVSLAYRVRFMFDLNARSAMHMLELRSTPQGHPAYRSVAQDMHTAIAETAGHHAIAGMMNFVNHNSEADLERLEAERRAEQKRLA